MQKRTTSTIITHYTLCNQPSPKLIDPLI